MNINYTKEEFEKLLELKKSDNEDVAFLANMVWRIVTCADQEESYKLEQKEREE